METVASSNAAALTAAGMATQTVPVSCVHCGAPCRTQAVRQTDRDFCCHGCLAVYELLHESGLGDFYRLSDHPGTRVRGMNAGERFAFLNETAVRDCLLDFVYGDTARVTLRIPAIHCVACVWLLENLFKLHRGIRNSVVNFGKKELTVTFEPGRVSLGELVSLLASIGYEPALQLDSMDPARPKSVARALYLKLGVAGFAFGNIMLFSVCLYSGMDRFSAPMFKPLFGWVSLLLTLPVLIYSAGDYWRGTWLGLRQWTLTIDLPIALGLAALFGQSLHEIVIGGGVGYLDSLSGLVFFLLIGRVFQDRTYQRLSFDRDYRAFFPLAVCRVESDGEHTVSLSALSVGDHLRLRHGELIPADACVVQGDAVIDYSFVTGETDPVEPEAGAVVYAGGRQVGGMLEVEILKPVSQSYLTSLWSHEAFSKDRDRTLNTVLNRFSRGFTMAVLALAFAAGAWWWGTHDAARAVRAFTSVLIVACPCALALSAPFAFGTAQRLLGRFRVFVRNASVLEALARVNAVVFDKTGTLTRSGSGEVAFSGDVLSLEEESLVKALALRSTHPHAVRIAVVLREEAPAPVEGFQEVAGDGIRGHVHGVPVLLGSARWLQANGIQVSDPDPGQGSQVHLALKGTYRGHFSLRATLRPGADQMIPTLAASQELILLSGDNDRERASFQSLLGQEASLRFGQSPVDKLAAIAELQKRGRCVMMVGDGLNDAGALRQSDVGVAVVEAVGAFSPASDLILEGKNVPALNSILHFARLASAVVWAAIILSLLYNAVGLTFAASGRLSPLLCAVLMPLSSISVVTFACVAVGWAGRRAGLFEIQNQENEP